MLELNNLSKRKIKSRELVFLAENFFNYYKIKQAEVSLVLIGDKKSQELNKKYRQKNKATDVLSFLNPDFKLGKNNFLGEIFINLSELSRLKNYQPLFLELSKLSDSKAKFFLKSISYKTLENNDFLKTKKEKEKAYSYLLLFIFLHGLLHLIGFDDEKEKERRRMLEIGFNFLEKTCQG